MFVKRLAPNVYDVFIGRGWDQWARVRRNGRGVHQIGGTFHLNAEGINKVRARVMK